MASSRTHTLTAAARFSDSSKSRFHYFLNNNADKAVYTLHELSKKQARQFSKVNKGLSTGKLPWNIAISVDATFLNRSSLHTDNSKRFTQRLFMLLAQEFFLIFIVISYDL